MLCPHYTRKGLIVISLNQILAKNSLEIRRVYSHTDPFMVYSEPKTRISLKVTEIQIKKRRVREFGTCDKHHKYVIPLTDNSCVAIPPPEQRYPERTSKLVTREFVTLPDVTKKLQEMIREGLTEVDPLDPLGTYTLDVEPWDPDFIRKLKEQLRKKSIHMI